MILENMLLFKYIKKYLKKENNTASPTVEVSEQESSSVTTENVDVVPELDFDIDDQIQYDLKQTEYKLGQIKIFYTQLNEEAKLLSKKCRLSLLLKDNKNEVVADSFFIIENGIRKDSISVDVEAQLLNCNDEEVAAWVRDIYLDVSKLPKQYIEQARYIVEISGISFAGNNVPITLNELSKEIFVVKEIVTSQLSIQLEDYNGNFISLPKNDSYKLPIVTFELGSQFARSFKLHFSNNAKEKNIPEACVIIDNVRVSECGIEGLGLFGPGNKEIFHLIHVENNIDHRTIIADGSNEAVSVTLNFDPTDISRVTTQCHEFDVRSIVQFSYWENKNGEDCNLFENKKEYCTIELFWHFDILPSGDWLCVDYGSSAIVCKYGNEIFDLRTVKDNLLRSDSNLSDYLRDETEKGTKFLSSEIILNTPPFDHPKNVSSLCSEQTYYTPYSYQAVFLSPTSSLIEDNDTTPLPCLKLLVGNEFLPSYDRYLNFEYYCKNANNRVVKVIAGKSKENANCLLRIERVLYEAYQVLFKYFITPIITSRKDLKSGLTRLVLTYPNTYTPNHLHILEKAVKTVLPRLYSLEFVSESDAVAAYYMHNWPKYHPGINNLEQPKEYVLVYDMGAGTLDLTYFSISHKERNIEILGRIGSEKAGNYIDHTIAEIVCKKLCINEVLYQTQNSKSDEITAKRMSLKHIVQQNIKPQLARQSSITFKFDGNKYVIRSEQIIADPLFKKCMDDCTQNLIKRFCSYMDKNRPQINTVIMSGRSCMLIPLQQALQKAIESIKRIGIDVEFFPKPDLHIDEELQKTIVSRGAEILANQMSKGGFARNILAHRLYASFGIVYYNLSGILSYVELLDYRESPMRMMNMAEFQSENKEIQVYPDSTMILVQTYLNEEDTLECYTQHDLEFISVMNTYRTKDLGREITLQLKVDNLNNVILVANGGHTKGMSPVGVDLYNEITRKSLWPIVFNE